jgi:hypothetical protein
MFVVEAASDHMNQDVEFTVTNTRQTSAGKMIFGRVGEEPTPGGPARRPPRTQASSA